MTVRRHPVLWLVLLCALAGCAGRQPASQTAATSQAADALGEHWQLKGRLALSNGRDGGSGTLTWQNSPQVSQLAFVGAFGRGSWRLTVTPGQAELTLSDGQIRRAADVTALIEAATGWQVPVQALRHWVTGQAEPGVPASVEAHPEGYLTSLRQHGWLVQFAGRRQVGDTSAPRKITATRGDERVRLLVKSWNTADSDPQESLSKFP